MHLYTAKGRELRDNVVYPVCREIRTAEEFLEAARFDYIGPRMRDGRRGSGRFISADCLLFDLDNGHSDEADAWKGPADLEETFPDVPFYFVESRNSRKPKRVQPRNGEPYYLTPRPKYHLAFPLAVTIEDRELCRRLMLRVVAAFPYLDPAAAKPEQPMFGVEDPRGGKVDGETELDILMSQIPDGDLQESFLSYVRERREDGQEERKIRSAFAGVCLEIGLDVPEEHLDDGTGSEEEQERSRRWLVGWAAQYDVHLGRLYRFSTQNHPDALAYCVSCPWEAEHSMRGPDNESVLLIERSGKLGYLCRHSHGAGLGWKAFRTFYELQSHGELVCEVGTV